MGLVSQVFNESTRCASLKGDIAIGPRPLLDVRLL